MKGSDVTEAQIEHARNFLMVGGNWPDQQRVSMDRDQIARMLAWYRAASGGYATMGRWTEKGTERPDKPDAQGASGVDKTKTCPECDGFGLYQEEKCLTCLGRGSITAEAETR